MKQEYKIIKDESFKTFINNFIKYLGSMHKLFIEIIPATNIVQIDTDFENKLLCENITEKSFPNNIVLSMNNFQMIFNKYYYDFLKCSRKGQIILTVFSKKQDLKYLYKNGFDKTLSDNIIKLEINYRKYSSIHFVENKILERVNSAHKLLLNDIGEYWFDDLLTINLILIDNYTTENNNKSIKDMWKLIKDIRKI
jgi:hypothetical protein